MGVQKKYVQKLTLALTQFKNEIGQADIDIFGDLKTNKVLYITCSIRLNFLIITYYF